MIILSYRNIGDKFHIKRRDKDFYYCLLVFYECITEILGDSLVTTNLDHFRIMESANEFQSDHLNILMTPQH